jgi:hypothetical protein
MENLHDVFEKLKKEFQSYNVYWRLGHSFDTIIDYLAISPDEPHDFGPIATAAYDRSTGNACWYDDFAWWGVASLKALQHRQLFPDPSGLKRILDQCWKVNYENAPNVWTHNQHNPALERFEPRFPGGVWNADWSKPGPLHACGNMPIQPTVAPHLGGIQNTVTNGLYLVLATRLDQETHNPVYRTAAKSEYDFLSNWFNLNDAQHALWKPVEQGALVRERAATFAANLGEVPGYNPRIAWAGDQGIILGGLVDRMKVVQGGDPNAYNNLLNRAKAIAAGVKSVVTTHYGGILGAWVNSTQGEIDPDPEDYATGPGVYWRYLLYAYQNNADLKKYFKDTGQVDFVRQNAEHPKKVVDSDELVDLTNRLAALVAATVMSKS